MLTDLNFSLASTYAARLKAMRRAEQRLLDLAMLYEYEGDVRMQARALAKAEELRRRIYH